jgi:hypothetical protein
MKLSYWILAAITAALGIAAILGQIPPMTAGLLFMLGVGAVLVLDEMLKPIPNAVIWRHPHNGGGIDMTRRQPLKSQRPHPCPYAWWGMKKVPLYFWAERKVEKPITIADLPTVPPETDGGVPACICGFQPQGQQATRLLQVHLKWNPVKTSLSEHEFAQQHRLLDSAYRKEAAVVVATAVQDKPLTRVEYVIEPWEPTPDLTKSPNALWKQIDWSDDAIFSFTGNGWKEAVKLGMGLAMIGMLLIAIFLVVGSVQRGPA